MTLKAFFTDIGIFEEKAGSSSAGTSGVKTASLQDIALASLKARYETVDPEVYGTYEAALAKLEGMTVKQNKAGKVYIFSVAACPEQLEIPYGIDTLSKGAFQGQTALRSIVLPSSLSELSDDVFSGCTSLQTVTFAEGLTKIGNRSFYGCTTLNPVKLPASLNEIGKEAFGGCTDLSDVSYRNRTMKVAPDAFLGCPYQFEAYSDQNSTAVEQFEWSEGRKGTAVITGYTGSDETIRVPSIIEGRPVTVIGMNAFSANNHLKEVILPDTVITLQKDVFRDSTTLERVHLSNGISHLTTTTFSGCSSLKEINIPDGVEELRRGTFRDAPVSVLHIGKSLRKMAWDTIGRMDYDNATGAGRYIRTVKVITVDSENPYLCAEDGCLYTKDRKKLLLSLSSYRNKVIPEGVEEIGANAFEEMRSLADVTLPESLVRIGERAFSCSGLRSVHIGKNVRVIEDDAFYYCENLSSVLFEEGIEEIGTGAFDNCPIVTVSLPSTVHRLAARSFSCFGGYDDKMLDLRISPENPYLRADGVALYELNESGKTLSVLYGRRYREYSDFQDLFYAVEPDTIHIADEAFRNCINLERVQLPKGLITIGAMAFKQTNLSDLVLPSTVEKIGEAAFSGKSDWMGYNRNLQSIKVAEGNTHFFTQDDMLYEKLEEGYTALITYFGNKNNVTLLDQTVKVYSEAFAGRGVQEVRIPYGVKDIGEAAFKGCDQLNRIHFGIKTESGRIQYEIIYLPQVENNGFFWDTTLRDQFMDCIRYGADENLFDYEKYDSLFLSISQDEDKVLVAVDRLKSAVHLNPTYAENYKRYLMQNSEYSVKVTIKKDNVDGLELLGRYGVIETEKLDEYISYANKSGNTEAQLFLMNYKNRNADFGVFEFKL